MSNYDERALNGYNMYYRKTSTAGFTFISHKNSCWNDEIQSLRLTFQKSREAGIIFKY